MEHRFEALTFGEEFGEYFRLEVRRDPHQDLHFVLIRDTTVVQGLLRPTFNLLRYLAHRSGKEVSNNEILAEFWPNSSSNIIDKHISYIRKALGDEKTKRYIETLHGHGFKFVAKVKREGDLGGVDAFPEWSNSRFFELLSGVERGAQNHSEDIRILTTGFSSGTSDLQLERLLRRGVRIKILMMNPDNEGLTKARYALRKDKETGMQELRRQIGELEGLAKRHEKSSEALDAGVLEVLRSDIMPCGFLVHTATWALLGIFPCHTSYIYGPMLEIHSDTDTWRLLCDDWKQRWADAAEQASASRVL